MTKRPDRDRIDAGLIPLPAPRTRDEIAERNQRVVSMREEGLSLRAIGDEVGCTKSNIEKILRSERKRLQQVSTLLLSTPAVRTPIGQDTFETPERDTGDPEVAALGHQTYGCSWCHDVLDSAEAADHARVCKLERDRRGAREAIALQDQVVEQLRIERALSMDGHLRW